MGRADEGVSVVDWATLTGRDARCEEASCRAKRCTVVDYVQVQSTVGMAVMAACLVVLGVLVNQQEDTNRQIYV